MHSNVPTLNNFKLPTLRNNPPPFRQFSRNKMLSKKPSLGKCLLNKLLNLNRGAWAPNCTYIPKNGYFHDKTKIFEGKFSSALFNAKNVAESNVP